MGKDLVLTDDALQEMLNKAVNQSRDELNDESLSIAGCNIKCILVYESNIRNEEKGIMPLKHYCMQNNMNHRNVFETLRDLGFIEYLDNGKNNSNILTADGFSALNGTDPQESPFITTISDSLFINDKDKRIENMLKIIKSHPEYKDDIYNSEIKNRKLKYSRNEKRIADALGIEIITPKEIENVKD